MSPRGRVCLIVLTRNLENEAA